MKKRKGLPKELSAIWDELEGEVNERIGSVGLEAFCGQVHRLREAQSRIAEEGMIVQDAKGNPMAHPAVAIEKQAQVEVKAWVAKAVR